MPVLHIDDPQVRIETAFALETLRDSRRIDPSVGVHAREPTRAVVAGLALRGRAKERQASVQTIHDDEYSARLGRAASAQGRERAFDSAATQISRHP